jgi:hypothetical protein
MRPRTTVHPPGCRKFNQLRISINHGIMEHDAASSYRFRELVRRRRLGYCLEAWPKDSWQRRHRGDVVALDTKNRWSWPGASLVATISSTGWCGRRATRCSLAPIDRWQSKGPSRGVEGRERECVISPAKVARPWGTYETVAGGPNSIKASVVGRVGPFPVDTHHRQSTGRNPRLSQGRSATRLDPPGE